MLGPNQADDFWPTYESDMDLEGAVVLDPFVGGGTSVVEASRCRAKVIGFDIDPVAAFITRFELNAASFGHDHKTVETLCADVANKVRPLHRTLVNGEEVDVLHHFWVEVAECGSCGHPFELHPHHQIAFDAKKGLQWAFCKACHDMHQLPLAATMLDCICGAVTAIRDGASAGRRIVCPHCTHPVTQTGCPSAPVWRLFAQEFVRPQGRSFERLFKPIRQFDEDLYRSASGLLTAEEVSGPFAPTRDIPTQGRSDQRPLIHGIRSYRSMFNDRQLLHLTLLGRAIATLSDRDTANLMALAFSEHLTTNCMYTGYAFGYRRISQLFAIHGYRHMHRPVEINPWLKIGRGTYPNAMRKIVKAVSFARKPSLLARNDGRPTATRAIGPEDGEVATDPFAVIGGTAGAAIKTASSAEISALPASCIDLILSDPPYLDNVSYSELSDFYLAWLQRLGVMEPPYDDCERPAPLLENLAASNRSDSAIECYADRLRTIFRECGRVLRPSGVFVFTYHHNSARAWLALAQALCSSGLACRAVVPLRGEGRGGLHTHAGSLKWDAVLICRKGGAVANIGGQTPTVSREAAVTAAAEASRYKRRLDNTPQLGFGDPDALNLTRAFMVAASTSARDNGESIPLARALDARFITEVEHAETR